MQSPLLEDNVSIAGQLKRNLIWAIEMFSIEANLRKVAIGAAVGVLAGFPVCAQSLQEPAPSCLARHGEKGQSRLPEVPSIGRRSALSPLSRSVMFGENL